MHKIPVTVITGFLGAGKTTLIRHLLQHNQGRRIAVLVNEFGEVGIDGELLQSCQMCDDEDDAPNTILELTNGCLCCTVQEEFLPTMQELLKRRDRIDCIVVETSGLALPKPLVQAFRWPEIRTGATVDGVITVVDGEAIANGQFVDDEAALDAQRADDPSLDHETPLEELFHDQLSCADLIVLTKTDRISDETRARVEAWLKTEVPSSVKILPCHQGTIAPDVLLGFNAAVEDHLDSRPSHHDHEEEHDHDDDIQSVEVTLPDPCDPTVLIQRLKQLVADHEIYRIKGFVAVPDKMMRLVVQGVGDRFDSFYDRKWRPDEPKVTRLVIIGRGLDAGIITSKVLGKMLTPTT
ncbi:MAG: cobalamin biosynthesis protein CobW [Leptolyngbyaceae bacterium]|nr:cobalamin biosynthesis protein CobW [Leptolyngbyaceae bacterium]